MWGTSFRLGARVLLVMGLALTAACSDDATDEAAAERDFDETEAIEAAASPPAPSANTAAPDAPTAPDSFSDAEARALFARHACNACHEIDEFRIGPAYRDVARRYQGDAQHGPAWLAQKIIHGGAGSWGVVPMVANPELTPEEARAIASWILALHPNATAPSPE